MPSARQITPHPTLPSLKKKPGDVTKLKGNSFYGKMLEDLGRHKRTKEWVVDKALKPLDEADKKNWLATDKFSERTPGLFNPEFVGTRGVWLTVTRYLVQNEALNNNKYSCKGVSKKHKDMYFQRYKEALDVFLKTRRDSKLEEKDIDKAQECGT